MEDIGLPSLRIFEINQNCNERMKKLIDSWAFVLLLCATLGLAPYYPEPHIWGKLKWLWGGAVGMGWLDWFDLLLHGFPWLLLLRLLLKKG